MEPNCLRQSRIDLAGMQDVPTKLRLVLKTLGVNERPSECQLMSKLCSVGPAERSLNSALCL